MNQPDTQSNFKHILDTTNSLAWFAMDAAWMLQSKEICIVMVLPTVLSGLILCFMENKKTLTFINIAILSWICMNVSWMFSDIFAMPAILSVAKAFFGTGILFIVCAVVSSQSLSETFSHFKRFRLRKFLNDEEKS